jgi:hypothetical protein
MRSIAFAPGRPAAMVHLALLLLLPVAAGCGSSQAKVSGTVLFNGTPLPQATVMFRPADAAQNAVTVRTDDEGHYEAALPVGDVKVSVDNRDQQPHLKKGAPPMPKGLPPEITQKLKSASQSEPLTQPGENKTDKPTGKYIAIPASYYDIEKSGLGFKVEGWSLQHDIELKGQKK